MSENHNLPRGVGAEEHAHLTIEALEAQVKQLTERTKQAALELRGRYDRLRELAHRYIAAESWVHAVLGRDVDDPSVRTGAWEKRKQARDALAAELNEDTP